MQSIAVLWQGFAHFPTAMLQCAVRHATSLEQGTVPAVDMPVAVGAVPPVVGGGGAVIVPVGCTVFGGAVAVVG
jgi:hypothetical protein